MLIPESAGLAQALPRLGLHDRKEKLIRKPERKNQHGLKQQETSPASPQDQRS
jgi:hypothetical protein